MIAAVSLFMHSDQVLSITVSTQEHVDTVRNMTSHNEVRDYLLPSGDDCEYR